MDPPPPSRKEHRPRGHDFGQGQGMNSQNENPNKALQVTAHKAPNLNADVGISMKFDPIKPIDPVAGNAALTRPAPSLLG